MENVKMEMCQSDNQINVIINNVDQVDVNELNRSLSMFINTHSNNAVNKFKELLDTIFNNNENIEKLNINCDTTNSLDIICHNCKHVLTDNSIIEILDNMIEYMGYYIEKESLYPNFHNKNEEEIYKIIKCLNKLDDDFKFGFEIDLRPILEGMPIPEYSCGAFYLLYRNYPAKVILPDNFFNEVFEFACLAQIKKSLPKTLNYFVN